MSDFSAKVKVPGCEGHTGKGNKACPTSKITFQTFTSPHVSHTSLQSILPEKS